jgi:hypothetical protein
VEALEVFQLEGVTTISECLQPLDKCFILGRNPVFEAWNEFSLCVTHSKFDNLLFSLSPSLWLTTNFASGIPKKAYAITRCAVV